MQQARQNRLKEEEEKLLVTARGEKEVEARRQETLRDQIERTTQAETEKQLARINAEREKAVPRSRSRPPNCYATRRRSPPMRQKSPLTPKPTPAKQ